MHSTCNKHIKCQCTWCYAQVLVPVTPEVLHSMRWPPSHLSDLGGCYRQAWSEEERSRGSVFIQPVRREPEPGPWISWWAWTIRLRSARTRLKKNRRATSNGAHLQDTMPYALARTEKIGRETGVMAPPVSVRSKRACALGRAGEGMEWATQIWPIRPRGVFLSSFSILISMLFCN
jgi:hypothetical protein